MNDTAGVMPAILRLYPELDRSQLELIGHLDGPALGIAGPGAGKTLTIALRGANMVLSGTAKPEQLVMCTYNQRAARELRQRFRQVVMTTGRRCDVDQVRIATIHSLCRRILQPHARRVGLRRGYRLLNEDAQRVLMLERFDEIFGRHLDELELRGWRRRRAVVNNALKFFNRIGDEMIEPRDLRNGDSEFLAALGGCYARYRRLLLDRDLVDFAHLQVWVDELLDSDRIAAQIAGGIGYLMCDEYQDTSYIQERILLRLVRDSGNLCVVGDEDQSLYRFRGASVENILRFADRLPDCRTVQLNVNYRSHPDIVRAYDRWMARANWRNLNPEGRPFRSDKAITAHDPGRYGRYPAVIAVEALGPSEEGRQLGELLRFLKRKGVIARYDQVGLLLHSVEEDFAGPYLDSLTDAHVPARCFPAGALSARRRPRSEVMITTIHQAKGLEWDVVIVGSLDLDKRDADPVGRLLRPYCQRVPYEPADRVAEFDLMRQFYVAFSRPRHLLVLTAGGPVHPRFRSIWESASRWTELERSELSRLARQRFRPPDAEVEPDISEPGVIPFLKRLDVWVGRDSSSPGGDVNLLP